jgi:uncharacterized protein (DUF433 family)
MAECVTPERQARARLAKRKRPPLLPPTNYRELITIESGKRGGRPCLRGMRISVYDVLGWLAAGMTNEQIIAEFPELTLDDIRASLAYAADRDQHLVGSAA